MWGIGFKHDLLQWIPIIGNTIPLSLSLQAAHTQMTSKISILDFSFVWNLFTPTKIS